MAFETASERFAGTERAPGKELLFFHTARRWRERILSMGPSLRNGQGEDLLTGNPRRGTRGNGQKGSESSKKPSTKTKKSPKNYPQSDCWLLVFFLDQAGFDGCRGFSRLAWKILDVLRGALGALVKRRRASKRGRPSSITFGPLVNIKK